jgi:hypothetical protein
LIVRLTPAAAASGGGARASGRIGLPSLEAAARAAGVVELSPRFRGGERLASLGPTLSEFWVARLAPNVDADQALARLATLQGVARVQRIALVPVVAVPNDSLWPAAAHLYQPSRADVHAPEAWDITKGDSRVVIAILDTGILPYHPDISADSGPSDRLWKNVRERDGAPGVDDDANGFVDDVWGWDFIDVPEEAAAPGEDGPDEDGDPTDLPSHGTAVAGIAGAIPDNAIGVTGLGWDVRLMALRVGFSAVTYLPGIVDQSAVAEAIVYATLMGAQVINCSFASVPDDVLDAAVDAAVAGGVIVVAAAGNNGTPHHTADRDDVITATATDRLDRVAGFANLGAYVDFAAPGLGLPTTIVVRSGTDSIGLRQPGYSPEANGTSFSAPQASAAAALLQSDRMARGLRLLHPYEMRMRLVEAADDISARNPTLTGYGSGRLNVERALTYVGSVAVPCGSATVGPPAVLETWSGAKRIAHATASGQLLIVNAAGDTVALAALAGNATSGVTVGDSGDDSGPALFVSTVQGVESFTGAGRPRAGWPRAAVPSDAGPAVADLDGDGAEEIVFGDNLGIVQVWRMDGSDFPGFPRMVPSAERPVIALADLDQAPGAEIIAGVREGAVHALRHDGTPLPGWPVMHPTTLHSVAVGHGASFEPRVFVAGRDELTGFDAGGVRRVSRFVVDEILQDLALADLDGDGRDDVVLGHLESVTVRGFDGALLPGWPQIVPGFLRGPCVVGPLEAGGAQAILVPVTRQAGGGDFVALRAGGTPISGYPKAGGSGAFAGIAQLDADAASEIAVGAGASSMLFMYEAAAGSWNPDVTWPTARGNDARTSDRLAVAKPILDDVPPLPVQDLAAVPLEGGVALRWTAASDVGPRPLASAYVVSASREPLDESNIDQATRRWRVEAPAGTAVRFDAVGLEPGAHHWLAVTAEDVPGNSSSISNVIEVDVGAIEGVWLSTARQPTAAPVVFRWYAAGGNEPTLRIHDALGRLTRSLRTGSGVQGEIHWDGRDEGSRPVPAGLYFGVLDNGRERSVARVVLLR